LILRLREALVDRRLVGSRVGLPEPEQHLVGGFDLDPRAYEFFGPFIGHHGRFSGHSTKAVTR
jgi:hypothetical protein